MEGHRLLMKGIVVLALAIVVQLTGSDHLGAAAYVGSAGGCAACFTEANRCEGHEDEACGIACSTWAIGECGEYDPQEVYCETELQVYEWVECW